MGKPVFESPPEGEEHYHKCPSCGVISICTTARCLEDSFQFSIRSTCATCYDKAFQAQLDCDNAYYAEWGEKK